MTRVLLVGGGLTSALTGALLRRELPHAQLFLWDKARGAGGRMATSRSPHDPNCIVDLGAQYISATPEYASLHKAYYDELLGAGVLTPLTSQVEGMRTTQEGTTHYVTPKGSSSIVKHFIQEGGLSPKFEQHVRSIERQDGGWSVRTQGGEAATFDVVVMTMPVPQVLGLGGTVKELIDQDDKLLSDLKSVEYSSRYALGLFFEEGAQVSLGEGGAAARYISSDPIARFIALDNKKRGSGGPSVVLHTSIPFGKANVEKTPDQVKPVLLECIKDMYPHWPEAKAVKCQKWRFSQVTSAFPGLPGSVTLAEGLVVGGDGFTHSNMDGCIESAKAVAEAVAQYVNSRG
ncbi:Renalase [Chionoecetes opilio]|uniref:Renalase n=1 Tax=Chionoecetes opilio TaxID=41210 RepID=A0A8J4XRV8_CHIOP|nr:Renalase [Chionoecetes opilio]